MDDGADDHADRPGRDALLSEVRRRETWLRASGEFAGELLGGYGADAPRLLVDRVRAMSGAPLVAVALPDRDAAKLVFDAVSTGRPRFGGVAGWRVGIDDGVVGEVFTGGRARIVNAPFPSLGSTLLVPLTAGRQALGVLMLARRPGDEPFREADLGPVSIFAEHAGIAVEFARALRDRHRLAVYEDRDRIARDLHDLVIQRLFAIGLGLRGMTRAVGDPTVTEQVAGFVAELDQTIREIRRTIFSLREEPEGSVSLRGELLGVLRESAHSLGFEPTLRMDGPLDTLVPDELRPDTLATLREALSNVARHAAARAAEVSVAVDRDGRALCLVVRDDGIGMVGEPRRRSGLANIAGRAERWHGTVNIDSAPGEGTTVRWTVPLRTGFPETR